MKKMLTIVDNGRVWIFKDINTGEIFTENNLLGAKETVELLKSDFPFELAAVDEIQKNYNAIVFSQGYSKEETDEFFNKLLETL